MLRITTLFFLFFSFGLDAAHLVGGELSYRCLGNNSYELRLVIYRDCASNGAPFDNPALITVFDNNNVVFANLELPLYQSSFLPINAPNSCNALPSFVCTQEGIYLDTVNLPPSGGPYTLSHQRCCRNSSIDNIPNPRLWGSTYTIQVPAQNSCNSSPSFAAAPPVALCLNQFVQIDMGAVETDGDSLHYFLCTPLHGGGNQVNTTGPNSPRPDTSTAPPYIQVPFSSPYSTSYPIASAPAFSIDPQSGLLTGMPNLVGQFVFAVCVQEWRNGALLSTLRRDFQFNVTSACIRTEANFEPQDLDPYDLCSGRTITFKENCINTTSYFWDFGIPGISNDTSYQANPTFTYPDTGVYQVMLVANPNTPCADTTFQEYKIFEGLNIGFTAGGQACFDAHSFNFLPFGNYSADASFSWNFGGQIVGGLSTSSVQSPQNIVYQQPGAYLVQLEVEDGFCREIFTDSVRLYGRPQLNHKLEDPGGCAPHEAFFSDSSIYAGQAIHFWDFGDGKTSTKASPSHTYLQAGSYFVSHRLTTITACRDTLEETATIPVNIDPTPLSAMSVSPLEVTIFDPNFDILISSENYTESQLIFPDGRKVLNHGNELKYNAKDTGDQRFIHIVENEFGCTDTTIVTTYVKQPFRLYIPNAFTPNGDGVNDLFSYSILGVKEFQIRIINRWGQLVFESKDPSYFWNGRLNNEGDLLSGGVYTYIIDVIDRENGNGIAKRGTISLIR